MGNGKIAILVPSRGRPKTFLRFLESFVRHSTPGLCDVILRNGESDPRVHDYDLFENLPNVIRVVGPDTGFKTSLDGTAGYCVAQQDLWERFPGYAAYLCIEDDCVFESYGFDEWLFAALDKFPNRVGMVELVDLSGQVQCQCFSAEWCNALGFLCHPEVGEPSFKLASYLASPGFAVSGEGAKFRHLPLLHTQSENDERSGLPKWTNGVVERFYKQDAHLHQTWFPAHRDELRGRLEEAARVQPQPDLPDDQP